MTTLDLHWRNFYRVSIKQIHLLSHSQFVLLGFGFLLLGRMKNDPPPRFFDKSYKCSDDGEREGGDWIPQNCLSSAHKEVRTTHGPGHHSLITHHRAVEGNKRRNSSGIIYTQAAWPQLTPGLAVIRRCSMFRLQVSVIYGDLVRC